MEAWWWIGDATLHVYNMSGDHLCTLTTALFETVSHIKQMIQDAADIPAWSQKLILADKFLYDGQAALRRLLPRGANSARVHVLRRPDEGSALLRQLLCCRHMLGLLEDACVETRSDREVVLEVVRSAGAWHLLFASDEIRSDAEFMRAAVGGNSDILLYVADRLKLDRDAVINALRRNGNALRYAHDTMKADAEVVTAALGKNWTVLKYASEELRACKPFVLAAVQDQGRALCYAAEALQADKDVALAAIRGDGRALQ